MNLVNNPDLLARLAASYALGTLRGPARRQLEAYARQSPVVRANILLCQERMCALTELVMPMTPSINVWKRIEIDLANDIQNYQNQSIEPLHQSMVHATSARIKSAMQWWRMGAVATAIATVAAISIGLQHTQQLDNQIADLAQRLKETPQLEYVAVLSDDKSAASMLVTFDPSKNSLTLKRVGGYKEESGKSLQLWALPARGGPQSLGVLGSEKVIRISAPASQVITIPMLAISLEPQGGVPSATGPTGPVLFKGALLEAGQ
jgi:anti-sigma-K factor RskA